MYVWILSNSLWLFVISLRPLCYLEFIRSYFVFVKMTWYACKLTLYVPLLIGLGCILQSFMPVLDCVRKCTIYIVRNMHSEVQLSLYWEQGLYTPTFSHERVVNWVKENWTGCRYLVRVQTQSRTCMHASDHTRWLLFSDKTTNSICLQPWQYTCNLHNIWPVVNKFADV